jgi:FAD/FMN-containing dehydrogenase
VARVAPEATAFAHRHAAFALNIVATWPEPGPAAAVQHIDWARAASDAMAPHCTGGVYVNFLGDEGEERVRAAYTPAAYERLRQVKRRHDPRNVFRLNQNIRPD